MEIRKYCAMAALLAGASVASENAQALTTVRIEAGGGAGLTVGGHSWVADRNFEGGTTLDRGNIAIAGAIDARIYQTERYGMSKYSIPVDNGVYTVKLHFAETYSGTTAPGKRVFDVNVEGTVLSGIDVFRETGGLNRALVKTVSTVSVNDSHLDIDFVKISGAPMINGIEVVPVTVPVNGVCGEAAGKPSTTKPMKDRCSAGTATEPTATSDIWRWQCVGAYRGRTVSCTAPKTEAALRPRGRVRIQNGTVVSDKGTMLRGTSAGAIRVRPERSSDPEFWTFMRNTAKLNLIRMGVKTKQVGRTVDQQLGYIDEAVRLAGENHMYLMINSSIESGSYDMADLTAFWTVVAPRYKDQTHVIYELTNEAVRGAPSWGCAHQYTDKTLEDLTAVWKLIRSKAPRTHIAWVDTPNLCDTAIIGNKAQPVEGAFQAMLDRIKGVDWSNSSVAFHSYGGTYTFGEERMAALKRKYPLIMTETNYWNSDVRARPYQREILRWYERQKISWVSLDSRGDHLVNEIIPNLREAGYTWDAE